MHAVLEALFDAPAAQRTPALARQLLEPAWVRLQAQDAALAGLFADPEAERAWLEGAGGLLEAYFALEAPRRLEPAAREEHVEAHLADGLRLHGIIDRLDRSPAGELRVVDYKTGAAPAEGFEGSALFQLKFYALVLWRSQGVVPALLQLVYLKNQQVLTYAPTEADLLATERKVVAVWAAVQRAMASGEFRPRPSRLCDWCAHQSLCPAFGGTPPPLPVVST